MWIFWTPKSFSSALGAELKRHSHMSVQIHLTFSTNSLHPGLSLNFLSWSILPTSPEHPDVSLDSLHWLLLTGTHTHHQVANSCMFWILKTGKVYHFFKYLMEITCLQSNHIFFVCLFGLEFFYISMVSYLRTIKIFHWLLMASESLKHECRSDFTLNVHHVIDLGYGHSDKDLQLKAVKYF